MKLSECAGASSTFKMHRLLIALSVLSALSLISLPITSGYEDKDLKCPNGQRITSFTKSVGKSKSINGKCTPFSPPISGATCKKGKSLKCDGQWEGCEEPDSWIGGFQVFDMDPNAEMYVPYCCTAPKVKLTKAKCQQRSKQSGNISYQVASVAAVNRVSCQYITSDDKKSIKSMQIAFEECPYGPGSDQPTPTTGPPEHHKTPSKSIKGPSEGQKSSNVNPSLCFTWLIVRNKALDYLEEPPPVKLITTVSASSSRECAAKCYSAEKELNRKCRSFKYSKSSCSLRENYVNGSKVQSLPAPVDITYGNWTSADCTGR